MNNQTPLKTEYSFWTENKIVAIGLIISLIGAVGAIIFIGDQLIKYFNVTMVLSVMVMITLLIITYDRLKHFHEKSIGDQDVKEEHLVKIEESNNDLLQITEKNYAILLEKMDKLLDGNVKLELTKRTINLKELKNDEGVVIALDIKSNREILIELIFTFPPQLALQIKSKIEPKAISSNEHIYKERLNNGIYLFNIPTISLDNDHYEYYRQTNQKIIVTLKYMVDGKEEVITEEIRVY